MIRSANSNSQLQRRPNKPHAAQRLIAWTGLRFSGRVIMSTSFGIQSAVTLHLVNQVMPRLPVIWVDTGYLPAETHEYAKTLTQHLNLNLHVAKSDMSPADMSPADMEERYGRLWESDSLDDLNAYDQIRKVEPMKKTLNQLNAEAWISGVRANQTDFRAGLKHVTKSPCIWRIHPLLDWTTEDVSRYLRIHGLPRHPLEADGFTTVGDAHSSRPLEASDKSDRDTRFCGRKQECGLHLG